MSSHPINLAIRFALELTTLFVIGLWCWKNYDGALKYVLSFGVPVLLAAVWGVFAVSGDPSRSGKTVVETAGIIRLIIELSFFSLGVIATYHSGYTKTCLIFGGVILLHYFISYDRVIWLIKQ